MKKQNPNNSIFRTRYDIRGIELPNGEYREVEAHDSKVAAHMLKVSIDKVELHPQEKELAHQSFIGK